MNRLLDEEEEVKATVLSKAYKPGMIYQQMAKAMKSIGKVNKSGDRKDLNFKFVKTEDIVEAASEALAENGICLEVQIVGKPEFGEKSTQRGTQETCMVMLSVKFIAEDGSFVEQMMPGKAASSGNESLAIAMTYAYKYILLKALCIPTPSGEEEDKSQDWKNKKQSSFKQPERGAAPPPAPEPPPEPEPSQQQAKQKNPEKMKEAIIDRLMKFAEYRHAIAGDKMPDRKQFGILTIAELTSKGQQEAVEIKKMLKSELERCMEFYESIDLEIPKEIKQIDFNTIKDSELFAYIQSCWKVLQEKQQEIEMEIRT